MKQHRNKIKRQVAKSVLRLPDLEVAKSAVLSSLSCPDAQRDRSHERLMPLGGAPGGRRRW